MPASSSAGNAKTTSSSSVISTTCYAKLTSASVKEATHKDGYTSPYLSLEYTNDDNETKSFALHLGVKNANEHIANSPTFDGVAWQDKGLSMFDISVQDALVKGFGNNSDELTTMNDGKYVVPKQLSKFFSILKGNGHTYKEHYYNFVDEQFTKVFRHLNALTTDRVALPAEVTSIEKFVVSADGVRLADMDAIAELFANTAKSLVGRCIKLTVRKPSEGSKSNKNSFYVDPCPESLQSIKTSDINFSKSETLVGLDDLQGNFTKEQLMSLLGNAIPFDKTK